jgi:hypothetical protein
MIKLKAAAAFTGRAVAVICLADCHLCQQQLVPNDNAA